MPDRPRDPRMPRATYRDVRNGTPTPWAFAVGTAVLVAWAIGGPVAAGVTFGVAVAAGIAWFALRKK